MNGHSNGVRRFFVIADIVLLCVILLQTALLILPKFSPRKIVAKAVLTAFAKIRPAGSGIKAKLSAALPAGTRADAASAPPPVLTPRPANAIAFDLKPPVPLGTADDLFSSGVAASDRRTIVFFSLSGKTGLYDTVRKSARVLDPRAVKFFPPVTGAQNVGRKIGFLGADHSLSLFDLTSGTSKDQFKLSSLRPSPDGFVTADLDGDRLPDFAGVDSFNRIFSVSGRDGSTLWSYNDAADSILGVPVVLVSAGKPCLVFAGQDGTVTALDGRSGWAIWKNPLQTRVRQPILPIDISGGPEAELLVFSVSGMIHCLAGDGAKGWSTDLGAEATGDVLAADVNKDRIPELIVGLKDGRISCLRVDGSLLWTWEGPGSLLPDGLALAVLSGGRPVLVAADENGLLHAVNPASGTELAGLELPSLPASALFARGDRVIFSGRDGQIWDVELSRP